MESSEGGAPAAARPPKSALKRAAPLLAIGLAAALFFASGAHRYLTLAALREHYATLKTFVDTHYFWALALYMLAYVCVAALSLPGATVMSLLGGFLFGSAIGTVAVVLSASIGASIIFIAARTAFRDFFAARAGGFLKKMETGFNSNAFSYLLLLRLVPLFPFFIVNIVPAFTAIRLRTYFLATLIGIIPGAFAFASAGAGLGAILERGEEIKLTGLLVQPEILTPIFALSILAIIPIIYRIARAKRGEGSAA